MSRVEYVSGLESAFLREPPDSQAEIRQALLNRTLVDLPQGVLSRLWRGAAADVTGLNQRRYCESEQIDESSFSRWLNGKRGSPVSQKSVGAWLEPRLQPVLQKHRVPVAVQHPGIPPRALFNKEAPAGAAAPPPVAAPGAAAPAVAPAPTVPAPTNAAVAPITPLLTESDIVRQVRAANPSKIFFIDLDNISDANAMNIGRSLQGMVEIALLLFMNAVTRNRYERLVREHRAFPEIPYKFPVHARSQCANAADVAMAFLCAKLDSTLPPSCRFVLVTGDSFAEELTAQIRGSESGRQCKFVDMRSLPTGQLDRQTLVGVTEYTTVVVQKEPEPTPMIITPTLPGGILPGGGGGAHGVLPSASETPRAMDAMSVTSFGSSMTASALNSVDFGSRTTTATASIGDLSSGGFMAGGDAGHFVLSGTAAAPGVKTVVVQPPAPIYPSFGPTTPTPSSTATPGGASTSAAATLASSHPPPAAAGSAGGTSLNPRATEFRPPGAR